MADLLPKGPNRETSVPGLNPATGWLFVVLVWLGLQVVIGAVFHLAPALGTNLWVLGAAEVLVLGSATLLLGAGLPPPRPRPHDWRPAFSGASLALRPFAVSTVLIALLLGVALNPLAELLRSLIEVWAPTPEQSLAHKERVLAHDTSSQAIALFAVVGLIGPFVEELFYRGALFTRISSAAGVGWAGFVSCLGFVFAHSEIRDWLALLLVAVALTWLRIKALSIWPSVACHVAFNATTLVALLAEVGDVSGSVWVVIAAVVSSFVLLAAFTRATGNSQ